MPRTQPGRDPRTNPKKKKKHTRQDDQRKREARRRGAAAAPLRRPDLGAMMRSLGAGGGSGAGAPDLGAMVRRLGLGPGGPPPGGARALQSQLASALESLAGAAEPAADPVVAPGGAAESPGPEDNDKRSVLRKLQPVPGGNFP